MWVGIPLFQLCKYTWRGTDTEKPNRMWFAGAASLTVALLAGFLVFCPSPSVVSAPIVIEYEPLAVVRTNTTGFAKQIHVRDGQLVQQGDVLMTLENVDLQQELRSLETDIKISELRSKTLYNLGRIGEVQLEQESLTALHKRQRELNKEISNLVVTAPQSGQILQRDLDSFEGRHFGPGDELLSIGQPGDIQAIALTEQTDIEWVAANPDADVELLIWGRSDNDLVPGRITHINPRARDDLPHEAFSASIGGPLAVVPRGQVESSSEDEQRDMMLTSPRVPIEISLSQQARADLLPGQTGRLIVQKPRPKHGHLLSPQVRPFRRQQQPMHPRPVRIQAAKTLSPQHTSGFCRAT